MLMALSFAEKLGKKGLVAVSLHPGVIGTNLGDAVDWTGGDVALLSMSSRLSLSGVLSQNQNQS